MKLKPVTFGDKDIIKQFLDGYPQNVSELSFMHVLVWAGPKKSRFSIVDDHLLLTIHEDGEEKFLQPVGSHPAKIIRKILEENPNAVFERVEKIIAEESGLGYEDQPHLHDYVYSVKAIAELEGDRYRGKRNFINRFEENNPEVIELDSRNKSDLWDLQKEWIKSYDLKKNPGIKKENDAFQILMKTLEEFDFLGVGVKVNGSLQYFGIGEKLKQNTFVEHFEKADTQYEGSYQYGLNALAKILKRKFEFINREVDLGITGIRKAKQSWHPVKMIEKVKISRL